MSRKTLKTQSQLPLQGSSDWVLRRTSKFDRLVISVHHHVVSSGRGCPRFSGGTTHQYSVQKLDEKFLLTKTGLHHGIMVRSHLRWKSSVPSVSSHQHGSNWALEHSSPQNKSPEAKLVQLETSIAYSKTLAHESKERTSHSNATKNLQRLVGRLPPSNPSIPGFSHNSMHQNPTEWGLSRKPPR